MRCTKLFSSVSRLAYLLDKAPLARTLLTRARCSPNRRCQSASVCSQLVLAWRALSLGLEEPGTLEGELQISQRCDYFLFRVVVRVDGDLSHEGLFLVLERCFVAKRAQVRLDLVLID